MKYDQPKFLSYPRPENCIPPEALKYHAEHGYIAQYKRNGTASEIIVSPDHKLYAFNRHGQPHKQWDWSDESATPFRSLPGKGWWVFCAELLHSKVQGGPKDTHYLHDILVADGQRLIGRRYLDRYNILAQVFGIDPKVATKTRGHYVIEPKLWLAKNYWSNTVNFSWLFKDLSDPIDEGLVLKRPTAKLSYSGDNSWAVKCRRPHKNYSW